ncbi:hypothetical protein [uncultured Roseobacter sp.]|uniref:hypothetical protein n=1 Tax=uncultured Roseobacter sp. TaxID=114847 RepID=UPI00260C396A|nr:hypothetical protein [uncultured Roseobacter sp.]
MELFVETIAAHREALEQLSSKSQVIEWAQEQDNLGITLVNQSYRVSADQRPELVSKAVAAHKAAISVLSSETHPLEWAKTQNNLGSSLQAKAGLEEAVDCSRSLDLAIKAHKAALSILDSGSSSDDRVRTLNNLATALLHLGSITHGQKGLELLNEAVRSFEALLDICTRETHPLVWAVVQENIAQTTEAIVERGNADYRRSGLQRVLELLDNAITIYAEVSDEHRLKECSEHRTLVTQKLDNA